ncbi:hypothetical protein Tco_0888458 [Tanacetum coccineum]
MLQDANIKSSRRAILKRLKDYELQQEKRSQYTMDISNRLKPETFHKLMASIIKTFENARFGLKLKKLIAEHPDQEKLQSKKVKLEAIGNKLY